MSAGQGDDMSEAIPGLQAGRLKNSLDREEAEAIRISSSGSSTASPLQLPLRISENQGTRMLSGESSTRSNTALSRRRHSSGSSVEHDSRTNSYALSGPREKTRTNRKRRVSELVHPLSPVALKRASAHSKSTTTLPSLNQKPGGLQFTSSSNDSKKPLPRSRNPSTYFRPETFLETEKQIAQACNAQFEEQDDGSVQIAPRSRPIAVTGIPGIGKTYLLRSWFQNFQRANPRDSINMVTIGETLASRDYLAIIRALSWSLSSSVLQAAKMITAKLAKEGLAPTGGAVGGPLDRAEKLCTELRNYLEEGGTRSRRIQTPSAYLNEWIKRTFFQLGCAGMRIWVALDGMDFVQDKDLDGNNTAEARELLSAIPRDCVGLIVSARDDYHLAEIWRLEGWSFLEANIWTESERMKFLASRYNAAMRAKSIVTEGFNERKKKDIDNMSYGQYVVPTQNEAYDQEVEGDQNKSKLLLGDAECFEKNIDNAAAFFFTAQMLDVAVQEALWDSAGIIRAESGYCLPHMIQNARTAVTLFDYILHLWEQDNRIQVGLLPCILVAIVMSKNGLTVTEISKSLNFSCKDIQLAVQRCGTLISSSMSTSMENTMLGGNSNKNEKRLYYPNDDFARAITLRYLKTDVISPLQQITYISRRENGLRSKELFSVLNITRSEPGAMNMVSVIALINASGHHFDRHSVATGQSLARSAQVRLKLARQTSLPKRFDFLSVLISRLLETRAWVHPYIVSEREKLEHIKQRQQREKDGIFYSPREERRMIRQKKREDIHADAVKILEQIEEEEEEEVHAKRAKEEEQEHKKETDEVEAHSFASSSSSSSSSLQEISARLHSILSSDDMDRLMERFREGGRRQQIQKEKEEKAKAEEVERQNAEAEAEAKLKAEEEAAKSKCKNESEKPIAAFSTLDFLRPSGPEPSKAKSYRKFADLVPDEEKANFLNVANSGQTSSYTAPLLILRRNAFVKGVQSVLPIGSIPDKDLLTLFDALDWTADSDRDGFVSWEDFIDLIIISAKAKELAGSKESDADSNNKIRPGENTTEGNRGQISVTDTLEKEIASISEKESEFGQPEVSNIQSESKALTWKLDMPDKTLSYSQIAALSKSSRVLTKQILPVYSNLLQLMENGDLFQVSVLPSEISVSAHNYKRDKRTRHLLPFLEDDLSCIAVCWCPKSGVVACSLMRREAPSYVGVQFLEPVLRPNTSMKFELSNHHVSFDQNTAPLTALSCYHGVLPSNLPSGQTTEQFEVVFCGCEDGSILFSELSDLVHAHEDAVKFRHEKSTSLITIIRYEMHIQKLVTCGMDGNINLIEFAMVGDLISGTKLECQGVFSTFTWHTRPVMSLQYCSESHAFLSAGFDTTVYIWMPENNKIIKTINVGHASAGAYLLEESSQVVTLDADVEYRNEKLHQFFRVFNLFSGLEQQSIELVGVKPQAKPVKGSKIVVGNIPGACGPFLAYDQKSQKILLGSHHIRTIARANHWQPSEIATHEHKIVDGGMLFSELHMQCITVDIKGMARIWDVANGKLLFDFTVWPKAETLVPQEGVAAPSSKTSKASFEGRKNRSRSSIQYVASCCLGTAQERIFVAYNNGTVSAFRIYNGVCLQKYDTMKESDSDGSFSEPLISMQHLGGVRSLVGLSTNGVITFWRDIVQADPLTPVRRIDGYTTGLMRAMSIHGADKTFSEALVVDSHGRIVLWNALSSFVKSERTNWEAGGLKIMSGDPEELNSGVTCCEILPVSECSGLHATGSEDGYLRLFYMSSFRGLTLVNALWSGDMVQDNDDETKIRGVTALNVSSDGKEIICGDAGGGIHVFDVSLIKCEEQQLDLYPVKVTKSGHWSSDRSRREAWDWTKGSHCNANEKSNSSPVSTNSLLSSSAVLQLATTVDRKIFFVGTEFCIYLFSHEGEAIGSFGQSARWNAANEVRVSRQREARLRAIKRSLLIKSVKQVMSPDFSYSKNLGKGLSAAPHSPLQRKLEARRKLEASRKREQLEKNRVESAIKAMNALSLGQLNAKTLDGREFANIEEIQGETVYKHLSMRSGAVQGRRFKEMFDQRRPLPPSTPENAHLVDSTTNVKPTADLLPQTPLNAYSRLTKGIHLAR